MKKLLVLIVLISISGCSFGKKIPNNPVFSLERTIHLDKTNIKGLENGYDIQNVQDGKMLLRIWEENSEMHRYSYAKQLVSYDIKTEKISVLKTFDEEERVWDFALIPDGFIYIIDKEIVNLEDKNMNEDLTRVEIIESVNEVERVLYSGYFFSYDVPKFYLIDESIYIFYQSYFIDDGSVKGNDIVLNKYQNGDLFTMKEIVSRIGESTEANEKEFLLNNNLLVGKEKVGFITYTNSNSTSHIYIFDKKDNEKYQEVKGLVNDLLLFSVGDLYAKYKTDAHGSIVGARYYSIFNNKEVEDLSDVYYNRVPLKENILLYDNEEMGVLIANRASIETKVIEYEGDTGIHSYVFSLDNDHLVIIEYISSSSMNINIIKIEY